MYNALPHSNYSPTLSVLYKVYVDPNPPSYYVEFYS